MDSREKSGIIDPLGFTNQTATILRGLNAEDLIPKCKQKNISTEVLYKLTKSDFMLLGADAMCAENIIGELKILRNNLRHNCLQFENKPKELLQILQNGQRQLALIQAFAAYCRLRLSKEQTNLYIDPDKKLRASDALCIAANVTLAEINDAHKHLRDLKMFISQDSGNSRYSYLPLSFAVTAISVTVCLIIRMYR